MKARSEGRWDGRQIKKDGSMERAKIEPRKTGAGRSWGARTQELGLPHWNEWGATVGRGWAHTHPVQSGHGLKG